MLIFCQRQNAFEKLVNKEIPPTHPKRERATLAIEQYGTIHKRIKLLKDIGNSRNEEQNIKYVHSVNKALQLHPYGTYAYKGKGASKSSLKGKGESATKPLADQIDLPSNHGFKDISAAKQRNKTLLSVTNNTK